MKTKYQKYLSGYVLLIVAVLLFGVSLVPGMFFQLLCVLSVLLVKHEPVRFKEEITKNDTEKTKEHEFHNFFEYLNFLALHLAISMDKLANVYFSFLLNLTLRKKGGYHFGNHRDTISEVIGRNRLDGTLTKAGVFVDAMLEIIDPGHSIKAIE